MIYYPKYHCEFNHIKYFKSSAKNGLEKTATIL